MIKMNLRKTSLSIAIIAFATMSMGFGLSSNRSSETPEASSSTFKVVNNSGEKVKLKHKGGEVSLNNGGSTSLSCKNEGNKIYIDGEHVHSVSTDDCGKVFKVKDWL